MSAKAWLAAAALLCAAACTSVKPGNGGALPFAPATAHASGSTGNLEIVLDIYPPTPPPPDAGRAGPAYVSPGTTRLSGVVQSRSIRSVLAADLTPGAPGCRSLSIGHTHCDVRFPLAPGAYQAAFTTYGGAPGTKNARLPLADALYVSFTVVAKRDVKPDIAWTGIPTHWEAGESYAGFRQAATPLTVPVYDGAAQIVNVQPLDAAWYPITGPGAPLAYGVKVQHAAGWQIATPPPQTPYGLNVTPPGRSGSRASLTVTAGYPDFTCRERGARCSFSFTMANVVERLFVLNEGGTSPAVPASVTAYDAPYDAKPAAIASDGTSSVTVAAVDAAKDVFIANCVATCGLKGHDSITYFTPPYASPKATITQHILNPVSLLVDPKGLLYAGGTGGVAIYAPPYTGAPVQTLGGLGVVTALAMDQLGRIVVANCLKSCRAGSAPDEVRIYYGTQPKPIATIADGIADPFALAVAPNGDLFVSNYSKKSVAANSVSVYTMQPFPNHVATIHPGGNALAFAFTPQSRLIVASCGVSCGFGNAPDALLAYDAPYAGRAAILARSGPSSALARPSSLVMDKLGNLIVANGYNDDVLIYAPPYAGVTPRVVTKGIAGPQQVLLLP